MLVDARRYAATDLEAAALAIGPDGGGGSESRRIVPAKGMPEIGAQIRFERDIAQPVGAFQASPQPSGQLFLRVEGHPRYRIRIAVHG
ncbi:hypothetical protein D3C81_1614650 [compost metagenome]